MFAALGQTWGAMTVLDTSVKMKLNPLQLRKAGAIIGNMQTAGLNEAQINSVCKALFFQAEEDLKEAWGVFDEHKTGQISSADFRTTLPLMGEDVPEDKIAELFALADADGSGQIEYKEFCTLVKAMNPQEEDQSTDFGFGSLAFLKGDEKTETGPKWGKRGTEVRKWREQRAKACEEILSSGVAQTDHHKLVEELLSEKAAALDAKVAEIRSLQDSKMGAFRDREEAENLCREIVMENLLAFQDIEEILPEGRRVHAKKCYHCFDLDGSGSLSLSNFTFLMRMIDPDISEDGVAEMFKESGADGSMSFRNFCTWCAATFGDSSEEEFVQDLDGLMEQVNTASAGV